jgi:hypothetical protein
MENAPGLRFTSSGLPVVGLECGVQQVSPCFFNDWFSPIYDPRTDSGQDLTQRQVIGPGRNSSVDAGCQAVSDIHLAGVAKPAAANDCKMPQ